jgi:tetratricopeptide (TPR) repeat protein
MTPRKNACRVVAATPELFDRVARALPNETTLWVSRAGWHAWHGRWAQAKADYARVIRQRGLEDDLFAYGGVLLLLGEEQAYEDLCRETVERFGDPGDPYSNYVMAKLCVMGPARCVDPQRRRGWAEQAAKQRRPWLLETLGSALLYAGKPEQALRVYEDNQLVYWTDAYFGLARAHHALGHTEAAQDNLRKAQLMFKQANPIEPGPPGNDDPPSRWILLNLYSRQTEAALSRPMPTTAPARH